MLSFKDLLLLESGGKMILGINALQANTGDIIRVIKRWTPHITISQGAKHHKIVDSSGRVITIMPTNIGPKGAIDTLTRVRNHLEKLGHYKREKGEQAGLIQIRQNQTVSSTTGSETPEKREPKEVRYKALLSRPSLNAAKRERIQKALRRHLESRKT
jgi:hypothetical protein